MVRVLVAVQLLPAMMTWVWVGVSPGVPGVCVSVGVGTCVWTLFCVTVGGTTCVSKPVKVMVGVCV